MSVDTLDETPKRKPFQRLMGAFNEVARVMADLGYDDEHDVEALEHAVRSAPKFVLETVTSRWQDIEENVIRALANPIASGTGLVVVQDMRSLLLCPHHLTTAEVRCDLAFVQDNLCIGVGSIHEVFEQMCKQPILMERLASQIATLFGPEPEQAEFDAADRNLRGLLTTIRSRGGVRFTSSGCLVRMSGNMVCSCKPGRQHRSASKFTVQETNGVLREHSVVAEVSAIIGAR